MSIFFVGTGNVGAEPEVKIFPQGNDEPRKLLRVNVRFDNPIPDKEGNFQDRGGFWAPVEIWHFDAQHWSSLYQKGMRVIVQGRIIYQEWEDKNTKEKRTMFKVEARDIGILPHRIATVVLEIKTENGVQEADTTEDNET